MAITTMQLFLKIIVAILRAILYCITLIITIYIYMSMCFIGWWVFRSLVAFGTIFAMLEDALFFTPWVQQQQQQAVGGCPFQ